MKNIVQDLKEGPTLCIYHGNCIDGYGAAWSVYDTARRIGALDTTEFFEGHYGQPPPDVTGKHVLIVDFSYRADVLRSMAEKAKSVRVIDHHVTALPEITASGVPFMYDVQHSGAALAWAALNDGFDTMPKLLAHIEDRDLWRYQLPGTKEIHLALSNEDKTFAKWSEWMHATDLEALKAIGGHMTRYHDSLVQLFVDSSDHVIVVDQNQKEVYRVPVANVPGGMFASDVGARLCVNYAFAMTYFDNKGQRLWSLRSAKDGGLDVSQIAKRFGGGGHKNAAGFVQTAENEAWYDSFARVLRLPT